MKADLHQLQSLWRIEKDRYARWDIWRAIIAISGYPKRYEDQDPIHPVEIARRLHKPVSTVRRILYYGLRTGRLEKRIIPNDVFWKFHRPRFSKEFRRGPKLKGFILGKDLFELYRKRFWDGKGLTHINNWEALRAKFAPNCRYTLREVKFMIDEYGVEKIKSWSSP